MTLWLKNTCYIDTETQTFKHGHIRVEEGKEGTIHVIDPSEAGHRMDPQDEILDCTGFYVMKSFAVGHHHAYSALATGMPAPKKSPANFSEILQYIWWNLDKALDEDMIRASGLATALACAKSGSTFIIDHHASPNTIRGSLDILAESFESLGINHLLCYEITDRDGKEKALSGLEETRDYLERNQGLVGLHASFTIGPDTLDKAVSLMEETGSGIHIHVAEDGVDQQHSLENYGKRVVERLADAGALESNKTLLVHCLHLDDREREIIRSKPVWVVENMESNLNNQVGTFDGRALGDRIFFGTDGMHSDMIRSAQAAYFAGVGHDSIDVPTTYQRMRKVHQYLHQNHFTGDGPNNLVILDYPTPTILSETNFMGHFVYAMRSEHVRHVISNGKLIVKDRRITTLDEEQIIAFTREQAKRLWSKL